MEWNLWTQGTVERKVEGVRPLLASWNGSTDPAQIRLKAYLAEVVAALSPLPDSDSLFLHMDIDVEYSERLLRHYDLENYLTPLFGNNWLPSARFILVSARKRVGGGSEIVCGAAHRSLEEDVTTWQHFSMNIESGAKQKERLYEALAASKIPAAPSGRVAVRLAWRCSATSRNWSNLWKLTGDAMGPVLGYSQPGKHFSPADDRITDLEMHLIADETIGHDVIVGMWWRPA